jgi:ATP-dependent helicase/DNAse subunit B
MSGEKISGGAATVQMQSVDPFAAFARGRLGIRELQRIEPGLPAPLKGSIAHQVLRNLFACKPDRDAIACWNDDDIEHRLESALKFPFLAARKYLNPVHQKLLELERQRLGKILRLLIESEKLRPDFSIECVEEDKDFEHCGVRLSLRIDRIDRLADNTQLIIDYKTGAPKLLLNKDGDLHDLQLAVYAKAAGGSIGGLLLINVDSRGISYRGTGGSVEWDAKRAPDWSERLAAWFSKVESAMAELAEGDVRINTRQPDSQARPLAMLSRIAELRRDG